ncbi:sigma-70 family RNA polymerase sigma factor [Candidatus Woesearchaeota archaeon]|nr:sigma-70 family RNA polymerase sigma factor [Candidatus Woesearchaeota archaeon]
MTRYPKLTAKQEQALFRSARRGNRESREHLFYHNLRLVIQILKPYLGRSTFDELFQEGQISLWSAIRLFNPDRGIKFSTYATKSIRRSLGRFLRKNVVVHGPLNGWQSEDKRPSFRALPEHLVDTRTERHLDDETDRYLQFKFLEKQVLKLHKTYRIPLCHYFGLHGYTYCESQTALAQHMGYSRSYAQLCIRRGLALLRQMSLPDITGNRLIAKRQIPRPK